MVHWRGDEEGMFFFEKKNQKTRAPSGRSLSLQPEPDSAAKSQKFFGSFFQKRTSLPDFPNISTSLKSGLSARR
jgi:hypothetical protein